MACDCHVHIVGPVEHFPQVAARTYTAGVATLESLRAAGEAAGVSRFVLVQPSFYGTDNSCLLRALEALGDRGRGVAAIEPESATPGLLDDFKRRGICGVRINLYSTVSTPGAREHFESYLQSWIHRLPRAGWHMEIIAPLPALISVAAVIQASPVPVVLDHYGLPGEASPDSLPGRSLLELARLPQVWVKLSAPYRVLSDPLATAPPAAWLPALLQAAPDRCVWGSDWPHTPPQEEQRGAANPASYRQLDYARVFGDFQAALPEQSIAERILGANPARLYGFPSGR